MMIFGAIHNKIVSLIKHLLTKIFYLIKNNIVFSEFYYFISRNKLISTLLLLSIFITYKNSINPSNIIFDNISKISFAYITSCVFYVVTQYIPNRKFSRNSYEIIRTHLFYIYSSMSFIISMINFTFDNQLKISKTRYEHSSILYEDKDIFCNIYHYVNGKPSCYAPGVYIKDYKYNLYIDLYKNYVIIQKSIEKILSQLCILSYDSKLVILLYNIKEDRFMKYILFKKRMFDINKDLGSPKALYFLDRRNAYEITEFLKLYHKLNRFSFSKETYKFKVMSSKEVEDAKRSVKEHERFLAEKLPTLVEYERRYTNNTDIF